MMITCILQVFNIAQNFFRNVFVGIYCEGPGLDHALVSHIHVDLVQSTHRAGHGLDQKDQDLKGIVRDICITRFTILWHNVQVPVVSIEEH